jgi:hypothetical protein
MSVDSITSSCQQASNCEAFLIAGAGRTVRPLPASHGAYSATPGFRINDAPSYQVDFWEAPTGYTFYREDCRSYGVAGNSSFGFNLYVSIAPPGELVAG